MKKKKKWIIIVVFIFVGVVAVHRQAHDHGRDAKCRPGRH